MMLALLFLIPAGLVWSYTYGPTSKVKFSFTESGVGKYGDSIQPISFALISDVHLRESPRKEITDEDGTRSILQEFLHLKILNDTLDIRYPIQEKCLVLKEI